MSERLVKRLRQVLPWLAAVVFCIAAVLVWRTVQKHGLAEIGRVLREIPAPDLALAGACAAGSYLCLTFFDFLGLRYVNAKVAYPKAALASFTALSVGHNVGLAALSSGTIRYRFYNRWGVSEADVARVVVFCGLTVAIGLLCLAGIAGLTQPSRAAQFAGVPIAVPVAIGIAAVVLVGAYLVWVLRWRRTWRVRGFEIEPPRPRIGLLQVVLGTLNFLLVAATFHALLGDSVDVGLLTFASFYAVGNAAAILSHVPGGFGVLEAIVLSVAPGADMVGALIAFRIVYYFIPLALGGLLYGIAEWRHPAGAERDLRAEET